MLDWALSLRAFACAGALVNMPSTVLPPGRESVSRAFAESEEVEHAVLADMIKFKVPCRCAPVPLWLFHCVVRETVATGRFTTCVSVCVCVCLSVCVSVCLFACVCVLP